MAASFRFLLVPPEVARGRCFFLDSPLFTGAYREIFIFLNVMSVLGMEL